MALRIAATRSPSARILHAPDWVSDGRPVLVVTGAGRAYSKLAPFLSERPRHTIPSNHSIICPGACSAEAPSQIDF